MWFSVQSSLITVANDGHQAKYSSGESSSIQLSSFQINIYALGKAHMRSAPSLRSFPNVAFETAPMFVWLTMALSRPIKEDRLALPLSTPFSSNRSMVWCPWLVPAGSVSSFSTFQIFREASHSGKSRQYYIKTLTLTMSENERRNQRLICLF